MKNTDLKDGMIFYTRGDDKRYYIINGYIYSGYTGCDLKMICTLPCFIKKYDNNFNYTYCDNKNRDIIKIFDVNGKSIWTRIDWKEVPIDTKVLVRDDEDDEWKKRHYAGYGSDNAYPFSTFECGQTSWTSENDEINYWKYCKLPDEE